MSKFLRDTYFSIILSTIKGAAEYQTIQDIINSMNQDIHYELVDVTSIILGNNSNNKIYHIRDDTINSSFLQNFLLRTITFLPLVDDKTSWPSIDNFNETRQSLFPDSLVGNIVNEKQITMANNLGNLIISKDFIGYYKYLITQGMASHLLKKTENGYDVDLSKMAKYSVRNDLVPYGARAIFDNDLNIQGIELPYTPLFTDNKLSTYDDEKKYVQCNPTDNGWLFAHNVFTSSLITYVTISDHLLGTHILAADNLLRCYYEYCNLNQGTDTVSRFIFPFVYGTSKINEAAMEILFGSDNVINRLFAFDNQGLTDFMNDVVTCFNRTLQVDQLMSNGTRGKTPFARDIEKYTNIFHSFIEDFVMQLTELQIQTII